MDKRAKPNIDRYQLLDGEIKDIKHFYDYPGDHKTGTQQSP